jgi:hypothetical protein
MAEAIRDLRHSERKYKNNPEKLSDILISKSGEKIVNSTGEVLSNTSGVGSTLGEITAEQPIENRDPLRQRIWEMGRPKWWKRLIKKFTVQKQLTKEEQIALAEHQRRSELEKLLRFEAQIYKKRITNRLTGLGLAYRYRLNEKNVWDSKFQTVKFSLCIMQPDAIYFKINTDKLPFGVNILQLMQDEVLTDLSLSCGSRVMAEYSETKGAWYIIERASGAMGIPNHVKYGEMLDAYPTTADGLSLPFGVTTNGRKIYKSLGNNLPHLLIGGTTGAGKSNELNVIICTLIFRNTPEKLKMLLIDLKDGLEFDQYKNIPHLIKIDDIEGIIDKRHKLYAALDWLFQETEKRMSMLKSAGVRDIGRYNQKNRKNAMHKIVFVIDEYNDIKQLPTKEKNRVEEIIINMLSRSRAVGIHGIICTQYPKSNVIDTRIKAVLPGRLAFNCSGNFESMAIIDNAHAKGLPVGRCILKSVDEIQIQAPYINEKQMRTIINGAISGSYQVDDLAGHDVTLDEILDWSLEYDNGYLAYKRVYENFKDRGIRRAEVDKLIKEIEDTEQIVNGKQYRVLPGEGNLPRRLVSIDQVGNEEN